MNEIKDISSLKHEVKTVPQLLPAGANSLCCHPSEQTVFAVILSGAKDPEELRPTQTAHLFLSKLLSF
jgi:hypothetical protein